MSRSTNNEAPPLMLEGFEDALVGFALPTPTSGAVAVYDFKRMVQIELRSGGRSEEEAEAALRKKYVERYLGTQSPIFCNQKDNNTSDAVSWDELLEQFPLGAEILWDGQGIQSNYYTANGEALHERWADGESPLKAYFRLLTRVTKAIQRGD